MFFFLFSGIVVLGELTSDELDDVCNVNDSVLFKSSLNKGQWGCANLMDSRVFNITVNNITNIYNNYSLFSNQTLFWSGYSSASQLPINNPFDQVLNTTSNVRHNNLTIDDTIKTGRIFSNTTLTGAQTDYYKNKNKITMSAGGTNGITNLFSDTQEIQIDNTGITNGVAGYFSNVKILKNGVVDPITAYSILVRLNTENASNTTFITGSIAVHAINDGNRSTNVLGSEFIGRNLGSGQGYGFYGYGQSGYLLGTQNQLTATGIEGFCQQSSGLCTGLRAQPFTANSKGFSIYATGNSHWNSGNLYIYNTSTIVEAQNFTNVNTSSKGGIWVQGRSEFDSNVLFNSTLRIQGTNGNLCSVSTEGSIYYNSTDHTFYGCNSTDWRALY